MPYMSHYMSEDISEDKMKIHQVLQNLKYIILKDIYVLKIAKIFLYV